MILRTGKHPSFAKTLAITHGAGVWPPTGRTDLGFGLGEVGRGHEEAAEGVWGEGLCGVERGGVVRGAIEEQDVGSAVEQQGGGEGGVQRGQTAARTAKGK